MASLLISAAHKSSGKTAVTLGLISAFRSRGLSVAPFKKGPDYIDPIWHARAAGRACFNLDFYTMPKSEIESMFADQSAGADIALIEGNKGLFDGLDPEGSNSNAALCRLLATPAVLVIDTRGMTRGIAPLLKGYQDFEPDTPIAGVILNFVGGSRHESKLRQAIENYTDLRVFGGLARQSSLDIGERHLGLVPANEYGRSDALLAALGQAVTQQVDVSALLACARKDVDIARPGLSTAVAGADVTIAIARDSAFGFYYADDLLAFAQAGARLIPFDALNDRKLPKADGLFIGGGFPETHGAQLQANAELRRDIRNGIESGMPAYAECGGLMYLSRRIHWHSQSAEMVGVLPFDVQMGERPQGRGYVNLQETADFPWAAEGGLAPEVHGHEFHYARVVEIDGELRFAYRVKRGHGIDGVHDGVVYKNLLASFAHLRQAGDNRWVQRFVAFVRERKLGRA